MILKFEEISGDDDIPDNCERCSEELREIYCRGGSVYDLVVLECPKCKTVYAYLIEIFTDSMVSWDSEDEPVNDHSGPLVGDLKKAFPKNCIRSYAKSLSVYESKNKELNAIITAKLPELYNIGLSLSTINLAKSALANEINAKTTTKQLTILIAAAIYSRANNIATTGGSWKHKGEGATERQIERIFGISRKTIRKWAERFNNRPVKGAT